jgi:hypothetical protein
MPTNPKEVQLEVSFASRLNALKKPWHVPPGVHHLMIVLELYCGTNRDFCWPSLKTLAEVMNVTERQVRRLIAQAVALELLFEIVEKRDAKKVRRFKIRQANMIELARRIEREKPARPRRRRRKTPSRPKNSDTVSQISDKVSEIPDSVSESSDTLSHVSDNVSEPHCLYVFESTKKEPKERTPPPPNPAAPPATWREVEEAVLKFPVGNWRAAVAAAKEAGCSPAQVLAIVAEANRRRAGWAADKAPGILYHRLRNAHPAADPADGWPGKHEAGKALDRSKTEAAQRTAEASEDARRKAVQESEQVRRQELEAAFGVDLDTMPGHELNELVRAALGGNRVAWSGWLRDPDISTEIFRGPVLRYMASRTREGVRNAAR